MIGHIAGKAKKTVAIAVCASLILTAPGLPFYQVFAAKIAVAPVQNGGLGAPAGAAPVGLSPVPARIGTPGLNASLSGALPAVSRPEAGLAGPEAGLAGPETGPAPAASIDIRRAVPAAAETPEVRPGSRISQGMVERAAAKADAPKGLFNVLLQSIKGQEASAERTFLRPGQGDLKSGADAKDWGERSFEALRGGDSSGRAEEAVRGAESRRNKHLLKPYSGVARGRKNGKARKPVAAPASREEGTDMGGTVPMFGAAAGFLGLGALSFADFSFSGAWEWVTAGGFFAGLSWPAIIGIQLGVSAAFYVGKSWWKKRAAKKEEEAKKTEALKELNARTLKGDEASSAVEAAASGKQKIKLFDFTTTAFHEVEATEEMLAGVRDGAYAVTTDDTGVLFLVPKIAGLDQPGRKDDIEEAAEKVAEETAAETAEETAAETAEEVAEEPAEEAVAEKAASEPAPEEGEAAETGRTGSNPAGLAGPAPRSFRKLPADARGMSADSFLREKAAAQVRARRLAKDARLVRAAINFHKGTPHWIFIFHSRKKKKILTVWQKRIGVRGDKVPARGLVAKGAPTPLHSADTLYNARLAKMRPLQEAYAELKAQAHWFKPVRLEIVSKWKKDPVFAFIDEDGRVRTVPAVAEKKTPAPPKKTPDRKKKPAPPETAPPPPKEAPPAEDEVPGDEARAPPGEGEGAPPRGETVENYDPNAISPHVHEGLFGFRRVQGLKHDPAIVRLGENAEVPEIISQIARQFNISHARVMEMAEDHGLSMTSPRAAWLAVYDEMHRLNREEFKHLDHKKYQGGVLGEAVSRLFVRLGWRKKPAEAGFRKLAGRAYSEGWRGALERALELHKHVVGLFIRVPYHLFDMFLFGYFRRNIAYEFAHSTEDFLTVSARLQREQLKEKGKLSEEMELLAPSAEKWLKGAMQKQTYRGVGLREMVRANTAIRLLRRWVWSPLASPLIQFVWRRATLAVFSAVAGGAIAGLIPLPFLALHLTAVPVLGPALVGAAHGLPIFAADVPLVGEALARMTGGAMNALVADLSVGALLDTFALSTMLTFPAAAKQHLMDRRGQAYRIPSPLTYDFWAGVAGAAVSWSFWSQNMKSMFGLMTVGAEIEAIMGYAGELDGFVNRAYQPVTGGEFKLFHTVAAAVERPEGESPIPFGGAISWGNVLIYKLQNWAGFNITDATYEIVHRGAYGIRGLERDDALEAATAAPGALGVTLSGQSVVAGVMSIVSHRGGGGDGDFKFGTGAEMEARKAKALAESGDLGREIAEIKKRIGELEASLGLKRRELAELEKRSKPLTAEEERTYREALKALNERRDEKYVQSKLAQMFDLKNPADDPESMKEFEAKRLKALEELEAYYDSILPEGVKNTGHGDSIGLRKAMLESLSDALKRYQTGAGDRRPDLGEARRVDEATEKRVDAMVTELEKLRGEVKGELVNRDALAKLLAAVNRSRNSALKDRRSGKEMLEFHKNLSKLATVLDLALSLNEIAAAQEAIRQMDKMLDEKLDKIRKVQKEAEESRRNAEENLARNSEWEQEAKDKIDGSKQSVNDMQELEEMTRNAVERIGAFRAELKSLLAEIDAEDAKGSSSAGAEYERRKALLPEIVRWMTDGKPGDEDFQSLKSLDEHIADIDDYLKSLDDGLSRIGGVPAEFAGVLVIAVPGVPDVSVTNPTEAQALQILADRKAHWQAELSDYKKTRDEFKNRLDPNHSGTEEDDFGDVHPVSLHKRLAQARADTALHGGKARDILAKMDSEAGKLNAAVPGANLPALGGMSLEQLKDAVKDYKDKLKQVSFPSDATKEIQDARMNLLKLGELLPQAAREIVLWAKADAEIEPIEDALVSPVPQAAALYENVVRIVENLIADIDKDAADVRAGFPDKQGLINRKRALLEGIRPVLIEAKAMITQHAVPFQKDAIKSFDPAGDKYAKLFDSQLELYDGIKEALRRTLPWALAANGAKDGDKAGGMANIQKQRDRFNELLNGYDDAKGHHDGVKELLDSLARRKDPNNNETEEVFGRIQPFSLPKAIAQNQAEKTKRAQQINAKHAEINDVLGRIDSMTQGKFGLARFRLPTDVQPTGQASVDRVRKLVDDEVYFTLGDLLTQIGNEYKEKGSSELKGASESGVVPVGPQPTPDVDDATKVALLALEAAKRLVPSTNQPNNVDDGSAAFAVAEFLFADGFVNAAEKNLNERIPVAEVFLNQAKAGLEKAVADLQKDEAYVQSDGGTETPDGVVDRKIAIFGELNAITRAGVDFYNLKVTWDTEGLDTVKRVNDFYDAQKKIGEKSGVASDSELEAILKIKDALKKTFNDLEDQKRKLARWMGQLNSPEESALRRVAESLRDIQDKTRAVLEQNVRYHDIKTRYDRANESLDYALRRADRVQRELGRELRELKDPGGLNPALAKRVQDLRIRGGMYMLDGIDASNAAAALVVPKKDFGAFVETLFKGLLERSSSGMNLAGLQQRLLQDPRALTGIIPNTDMLEFGGADGFYLVYQSEFSVPHGLETSNWVTLGNVAKLWGNNISVTGYQFASPPNDENAPWGDKGVEVQVESLQGKNWVNYLNIDFHRFIQDIPPDTRMTTQVNQSRLMIFDDFAMLAFGGKLYVGLTGFADIATDKTAERPRIYGGSAKTELKFTEVMSLTAEQQRVIANDPREFFQELNLDFTGLDKDISGKFPVAAKGENKDYTRTQVGPRIDVAKLLKSEDAFTVDLFWAKVEGTDDYNQQSLGVSVLKGFTLKDSKGKPWMIIQNKAGYEKGEKFGTLSDRVSVTLPDWGVVVNAEGRLIGEAKTYFLELAKKTGDNTNISLGYGSRYVGQEPRLRIGLNSSFTLGELWSAVSRETGDELEGSKALKSYNREMDAYFKEEEGSRKIQELKSVYLRDVGTKLIKQDIGKIAKEIQELRKAGAFMDNTRVRGMVGFVTNSVGEDLSDKAVGGGSVAGTHTTMELTKTQKALIDSKLQSLYRESMRLQFRMMELTKQWQETVVDIVQAQWELKMAGAMSENAPSETLRREGAVRAAEAEHRLRQAVIRYNMLSGRSPDAEVPFKDLSADELRKVIEEVRSLISAPDRLVQIFHKLDREEVAKELGDNPFNIVDWIPWVDKLTLSFGAQFEDYLANQIIGAGITLRLPVYDPASKELDKAYVLTSRATVKEIEQVWRDYRLRAAKERQAADTSFSSADAIYERAQETAKDLDEAVRAYRNGLIGDKRLREAFSQWNWYVSNVLAHESRGSLAAGWAALDSSFGRPATGSRAPASIASFQDVFALASKNSNSLEEIALRRQAAAHKTEANNHRIQKFYVDLFAGYNFTASGVGWLPSIGVTGLSVTPILTFELKPEELRELQVAQGRGEEKYYKNFKAKLEADLALDIYRSVVSYHGARRSVSLLEGDILPALRRELGAAREAASDGDPAGDVARLTHELDIAGRKLLLAKEVRANALSTLNYLLGRPEDAPLDVSLTPERALAELRAVLDGKDPVAVDKAILDSRVEVAKAVETMVDKDLKLHNVRLEPVSLVVRSLGRLLSALSSEGLGNAERVAAARIQTLEAERTREAYDRMRAVRYREAQAELSAAKSALARLEGRTDAASRLARIELESRVLAVEAAMARLGAASGAETSGERPSSWRDLTNRVLEAEQALAYAGRESEIEVFQPESLKSKSTSNARYFRARTTLGGDPIGENYVDSWVEVRLRDPGTPSEVLLALAKLRTDKADRINRNLNASSRSQGRILLSEFETNVRLLRWAEAIGRDARARAFAENLAKFKFDLAARIGMQADRIKALLGLPAETGADELARLVPADPGGHSGDLGKIAERFIKDAEALRVEQLRETIFSGGIPASLASEDGLINQLRADVIAEQMSYNGFTPVAAFGIFRAHSVGGFFMEAPDPRSIQRGLEQVLSDSIRKELLSQGRMQTLAQHLHLLMSAVSDKAKLVERQHSLIKSAEADYRAAASRLERGMTTPAEAAAAQKAFVDALAEFSKTVAELKNDFIRLVTELEAIGYPAEKLITPAGSSPVALENPREAPAARIVEYASRRALDSDFAGKMIEALQGQRSVLLTRMGEQESLAKTLRDKAAGLGARLEDLEIRLAKREKELDAAGAESPTEDVLALRREVETARSERKRVSGEADAKEREAARLHRLSLELEAEAKALKEAADSYREIAEYAGVVRYHDMAAAEKLGMLTDFDVEGHRLKVSAVVGKILATVEAEKSVREAVLGVLSSDLGDRLVEADSARVHHLETILAMREGVLEALELPFELRGAAMRLEALLKERMDAKQALLEDYMLHLKGPGDFLLRDMALDRYLKAVVAYDAEVLKTFERPEVAKDPEMIRKLGYLYGVREAIARQKVVLKSGRAMLAVDTLIMLQEGRLAALRWDGAPRGEVNAVLNAIEELRAMRDRFAARDTRDLSALYVVTETDADGRRLWSSKGWLTGGDVEKLLAAKEAVRDAQGRLWLLPKDGGEAQKLEIVSGVDAAAHARDSAGTRADANAARRKLYTIFETHEFAAVRLDGGEARGLTYEEALAVGSRGAMFHFSKETGTGDLHPSRHPLQALWSSPGGVLTVVYLGKEGYSRDRFPTLESLRDHVGRLRESGRPEDAAEADNFYVMEAGPKGVEKMAAYAREHGNRSERRGWMGVKLQSYGFAMEDERSPAAMYLTKDDFLEAKKALEESPRILSEASLTLLSAKAEEDAARVKMEKQKVRLDGEALRFGVVQKEVGAAIEKEMAGDFPRKPDEPEDAYAARFKAELHSRLVQNREYIRAQELHAEELQAFNELHEDYMSKLRKADKALDDLTKAGLLIARSGRWAARGADYLETLRKAGVPEKADPDRPDKLSVEAEAEKLAAIPQWRLFVTRDMELKVDESNTLAGVRASPVFGGKELDASLGSPKGGVRTVKGEIYAAVMDTDQTLVRLYMDAESVKKAGEGWALADQKIVLAHQDARKAHEQAVRERGDGKTVDPNYRLLYYVDSESKLPVQLNRRYMISRLVESGKELAAVESWGYGPWNWGNILMEIPRGVLGTPIELLTGRDPNQNGYLGRVHLRKIEGGATEHHGFFRKALGMIDFLDLMPDPVDWYFDASQFPEKVRLDSAIKPGENIYDKGARTEDKDIHFGRRHVQRTIVYEVEDLVNASKRVRSYFEGGLQDVWLEHRRGRERVLQTSRVSEIYGRSALENALSDPLIAGDPNSDGRGTVRLGGVPGHIEVDRIERHVTIRPGAKQYEDILAGLKGFPDLLAKEKAETLAAAPELGRLLEEARRRLADAAAGRTRADEAERAQWEKYHEIAWRVGRQRAIEAAIEKLKSEIAHMEAELARLRERLAELERRRDRENPGDPDRRWPWPGDRAKWWPWILTGAFILALAAAIWDILRRRRRSPGRLGPPGAFRAAATR